MKNTASTSDMKNTPYPCIYGRKCGSCRLQNLTYAEQLSFKQRKLISLLGKFCHVDEIAGMDEPFHYRNKLQAIAAGSTKDPYLGIYRSESGDALRADDCLIEDVQCRAICKEVEKLVKSFNLKPYDNRTKTGYLRHIMIRKGFTTGEIMLTAVTACDEPLPQSFVNAVRSHCPDVTTFVRSINDGDVPMMIGERCETLFGSGYIEDTLCGMVFRISPRSFYQVNPVQTEVLYKTAAELAAPDKSETLIDAYCGTGTIGLIMSRLAGKVIGAEINADAIQDAKENARINNVDNAEFICLDAGEFMERYKDSKKTADIVVTDPPRAGCSRKFLQSLIKLSPDRIVYISCEPETLARDMSYLVRHGYHAKAIRPVDMFPYTTHIETVVLLTK